MRILGSTWNRSAMFLLLFAPAAAQAQKTSQAVPVPPSLFLIYALEDLYRSPLPENAELFEAFVAGQQVQYDQVVLYLSKQKNRDAELVGHFDEYRKVLDRIRELSKEVEASQKRYIDSLVKARLKLQYEEMRQSNAVLFAGLSQALGAYGQGGSDEDAVKQGLSAAIVRAIDARYPLEAARAEAQVAARKARADFQKDLNSYYPNKKQALQKQLGAGPPLSKELLARLAEKHKWKREVDLDAGNRLVDWGAGEKPTSPLWMERIVVERERKPPEGIAAAEFYLRNAKDFLWAARMVPSAKEFNSYRTRLYVRAGLSANRAAAAQIGTAGFKAAPADAAKTALDAWYAYARIEPVPVNDCELRRQYMLAHAYGSKKEQGQAYLLAKLVMKQMNVQPSLNFGRPFDIGFGTVGKVNNRAFWYDAARICSLVGDVPSAFSCLHAAVQTGFRDMQAAKVHPDLANLRAGAPDQFNKLTTPAKK